MHYAYTCISTRIRVDTFPMEFALRVDNANTMLVSGYVCVCVVTALKLQALARWPMINTLLVA